MMLDHSTSPNTLDAVFRPRSVAVIGASSSPDKIGGLPVHFLKSQGFSGRVLPINPKASEIQGLAAYPSIQDAPGPVDLAIIAVPAAAAERALLDCVEAGERGVVMFSSGFAELGENGKAIQHRMADIAHQAGIRQKVFASFSPVLNLGPALPGRIGLISQSGAFGGFAYALARKRGIGLSHWITTGNEADISVAECIEWLAGDTETDAIVAYIEGCRDGDTLRRAGWRSQKTPPR